MRSSIIIGLIVGAVAIATSAILAPTVFASVRHDAAVAAWNGSEDAVRAAIPEVSKAQIRYHSAGASAVTAFTNSGKFLSAVEAKYLQDATPLTGLRAARGELAKTAQIKKMIWGELRIPVQGAPPFYREVATPSDDDAMEHWASVNQKTAASYLAQVKVLRDEASGIRGRIDSVHELTEEVLREVAAFGRSSEVKAYDRALPDVQTQLHEAIVGLKDENIDPVGRYTAFVSAFKAVKKSHEDVIAAEIAEQERIAAEKEAQRLAEEEAKHQAAQEEADRLEAERKASEQADQQEDITVIPAPTPEPAPTPMPTSSPTPTPTPAP